MYSYRVVYCYDGDIQFLGDVVHKRIEDAENEMIADVRSQIEDDENFKNDFKKEVFDFFDSKVNSDYCSEDGGLYVNISKQEAHITSDAYHCHWKVLKL